MWFSSTSTAPPRSPATAGGMEWRYSYQSVRSDTSPSIRPPSIRRPSICPRSFDQAAAHRLGHRSGTIGHSEFLVRDVVRGCALWSEQDVAARRVGYRKPVGDQLDDLALARRQQGGIAAGPLTNLGASPLAIWVGTYPDPPAQLITAATISSRSDSFVRYPAAPRPGLRTRSRDLRSRSAEGHGWATRHG